MSRFDDFDDFVGKLHNQPDTDDDLGRILAKHRQVLKKSFEIFGDFYKNVLEPRGEFVMLAKPKDNSATYQLEGNGQPIYKYMVFVFPKNDQDWPHQDTPTALTNQFELLEQIVDLDWNPNVVLQFSVEICPIWDNMKKAYIKDYKPRIEIKSWGAISHDQVQALITNPHVASHGKAWDKDYSIMRLMPTLEFKTEHETELINALKLSGANAINHRTFWFGPRVIGQKEVKKLN